MHYSKILQLVLITICVLSHIVGYSQNNVEYYSKQDSSNISNDNNKIFNFNSKLHFGLNAGTNVLVSSKKTYFSNVFVAPNLNYDISSKFTISSGILISNLTTNAVFPTGESNNNFPKNITQTCVFIQGQYKLNSDITLYGTGYYNVNNLNSNKNQNIINYNNKGYSFGLDYKINSKTKIGLEFHYGEGNNHFNYINTPQLYPCNFGW